MKYVIIGASAAGVTAAETIRKNDDKGEITLISDEKNPLYSRCLLTYFIGGAIGEDKLSFKNKDFYKQEKVNTHLGKKAVSIDRKKKIVSLKDGTKIPYDKLLIATGASPKRVKVPGVDKEGVFTIRKIEDAHAIIKLLDSVKSAAVLGGGLIGLRDAYALRQRKKEVSVIVKSPQILSQMLDKEAADMIASLLEKNGIRIMTGFDAKEITGAKSVGGVILDNGEKIGCQLVIIGKGVTPNTELASACGLDVKEGIAVNEFMQTSDENIFAAGDVAETYDIAKNETTINAIWPCAVDQGKMAGLNMAGEKEKYDGSLSMNSIDFFGLGAISMGITKPKDEGYEIIRKASDKAYRKFVIEDNRIIGMVMVGDIKAAGVIGVLIKSKADISVIKDILLDDNFNYAKIMPIVKKLEDWFKQEEFKDTLISYKP